MADKRRTNSLLYVGRLDHQLIDIRVIHDADNDDTMTITPTMTICISYKDDVTNEEVRAKIQQAIGPHEDLTIVKKRKLQWYGHVSRSSGLDKTILQVQ